MSDNFLVPEKRMMERFRNKRLALRSSCHNFDAGHTWEAMRIANEVYQLVFDGKRSTTSVLTHVGVKRSIKYINSIQWHPLRNAKRKTAFTHMVSLRCDDSGWHVDPLCSLGKMAEALAGEVSFSFWWEHPIGKWPSGTLNRCQLIRTAGDQDGGRHVDANITEKTYVELATDLNERMRVAGMPMVDGHLACLRQIGWEMERTLDLAFGPLEPPK